MTYPSVLRRYLATLVDILFLWFCIYGITRLPAFEHGGWRVAATAGIVLVLYEPMLTSFGCTLGQWLMRFRVRSIESFRRIPVLRSYARLGVKYLLGGISLLTIPARLDRRAIHDLAVDSIVVDARSVRSLTPATP
jgi:uncharacterized RDD family membrane protein YckC